MLAGFVAIIFAAVCIFLGVRSEKRRSKVYTEPRWINEKVNTDTLISKEKNYELDDKLDDELDKLNECTTSKGMKPHLDKIRELCSRIPADRVSYYEDLFKDAEESYQEMLQEEAEERFDRAVKKSMDDFRQCVDDIVHWDFKTCDMGDVNLKKCMKLQKKILDKGEELNVAGYALKELALHSDVDVDALEERLSTFVEEMKPEAKRKKSIMNRIQGNVPAEGNIKRSELKKSIEGDPKEIDICYKQLIEKRALVEEKIGERFYVKKMGEV